MIIRVFRARIRPGMNDEFERFLREGPIPKIAAHPGLVSQHVGRPSEGSPDEFVYVSVWQDIESLRGFAGDQWQEAVIDREEEHLLLETHIHHYEALDL